MTWVTWERAPSWLCPLEVGRQSFCQAQATSSVVILLQLMGRGGRAQPALSSPGSRTPTARTFLRVGARPRGRKAWASPAEPRAARLASATQASPRRSGPHASYLQRWEGAGRNERLPFTWGKAS